MDSSAYPAVSDDIDNVNGDEQDRQEEESYVLPETGNTNQSKRKFSSGGSAEEPKAKKKIQERSWVWEHFRRFEDNQKKCNCQYCGREMACPTSSGTSNLIAHLTICKKYQTSVLSQSQSKLNREGDGSVKFGRVSEAIFKDASNELLVMAELPLSFIESVPWRYFCNRVKLHKPHSRRTATREIVQKYVEKKEEMRNLIGKHRVSLTTDIWVAPTTAASYMVITAHWIDANWRLRKLIIGFKNISDHKGKTIASVLIECLADWRIKKLFTITVDNATSNTSALEKFKEEYKAVGNDMI